jgi:hypothetical protein
MPLPTFVTKFAEACQGPDLTNVVLLYAWVLGQHFAGLRMVIPTICTKLAASAIQEVKAKWLAF